MIAVIFEVWPNPDKRQKYLDLAAALRPSLEGIDGYIHRAIRSPARSYRCRFFRDETAVGRVAQCRRTSPRPGCRASEVFANYRLRVASVIRDYACRPHTGAER